MRYQKYLSVLFVFALLFVARADAGDSTPVPPAVSVGDVFRRHVTIWENGRSQDLVGVISEAYQGHTSAGDRDRKGLGQRIEKFHSLFKDIHFTILDQVISGERVATRLEATATEISTQQPVHMYGMNVSVVRAGMIVEEWAVWETVRKKTN